MNAVMMGHSQNASVKMFIRIYTRVDAEINRVMCVCMYLLVLSAEEA